MSQLSELKSLGSQLGQLKCLRLQSLEERSWVTGGRVSFENKSPCEEEDVTGFVSLLHKMSLEPLQIKDFAIDRTSWAQIAKA